MKTSELLAEAADVIRERGLAKHMLSDDLTGAVCVNGALNVAHHGNPSWQFDDVTKSYHLEKPCEYIGRLLPWDHEGLSAQACWNNHEARTQNEVIELLEEAASMAASDGD